MSGNEQGRERTRPGTNNSGTEQLRHRTTPAPNKAGNGPIILKPGFWSRQLQLWLVGLFSA
jgi:hypothetical protein